MDRDGLHDDLESVLFDTYTKYHFETEPKVSICGRIQTVRAHMKSIRMQLNGFVSGIWVFCLNGLVWFWFGAAFDIQHRFYDRTVSPETNWKVDGQHKDKIGGEREKKRTTEILNQCFWLNKLIEWVWFDFHFWQDDINGFFDRVFARFPNYITIYSFLCRLFSSKQVSMIFISDRQHLYNPKYQTK